MAAVVHFPQMLDRGPLDRARRPLAVIAALVLVIDLIGLGLNLADSVDSPFADDAPTPARARVRGPEAVVPGGAQVAGSLAERSVQPAKPLGCLTLASGCYPATAATPAPAAPPSGPGTPATPPPTGPTAPVPVAQAGVGVPALGVGVSLGVGEGGCTGLELTVLSIGDCPAVSGDGPVVVNLGGALLGE